MKCSDILTEVAGLVSGDRESQHGPKLENHQNIADLWSEYLGISNIDLKLTALDVALMMVLLKVARTRTGKHNLDDYKDMAGYAAIAGEIAEGETNEAVVGRVFSRDSRSRIKKV